MKLSKSELARHREAFLKVLEQLCEFAVDVLRRDLKNIKNMLMSALQDQNEQCFEWARAVFLKSDTI